MPIDPKAVPQERLVKSLIYAGTTVCLGLCIYAPELICTLGPFWTCVLGIWRSFRSNATPAPVARLMDLPPNGQQHPVSVNYRFRAVAYGSDLGVVTFDENWLIFEGLESHFTLSRGHVHTHRYWELDGQKWAIILSFLVQRQPYRVELRPLPETSGGLPGSARQFYDAKDRWERSGAGTATGCPLFPPWFPSKGSSRGSD